MSRDLSKLKVAIVCDWLTGYGGAEQVLLQFHNLFPTAPIYTSQYNPNKIDWFKRADVRTTWLQKIPSSLKKFMPILRAASFNRLDLSKYDLVLSSTGAEAKAVKCGPNTVHVSYIHSPTQYYWVRYDEYLNHPGFGVFDWLARIGLKTFVRPLKRWDYKAAQKPDYILTNSAYTQSNIKKYYNRESTVIHPPVNIKNFQPTAQRDRQGFVTAGRQTPYKRLDLVVAACTAAGLDLKVIGDGPDHANLLKLAGPTVEFLTNVNSGEMPKYFQSAEGFIFPNVDDFGIVAVEALAAGTPVIGFAQGGVLDYVNKINGLLFTPQTTPALIEALKKFASLKFNNDTVSESVTRFSPEVFASQVREFLNDIFKNTK
jgi:glycosyltransferase involved in cell wall biosynthesis